MKYFILVLLFIIYFILFINMLVVYPTVALVFLGVISGIQIGTWFYKLVNLI